MATRNGKGQFVKVEAAPKAASHRQTIKGGVVRSQVTRASMASVDPFAISTRGAGGSVNIPAFASESGRRGAEVFGLTSGPITTSILNSTVARKRSRFAVLTNPYAKRSIDIWVSNLVGAGHRLQSKAPDKAFRKQVEELWDDWCEGVDVTGKLSFAGMEALACRSMLEGGDCFIRMRTRRPEDGLVVPLQLQIYEAEQVPVTKNQTNGLNQIIAGIEFGLYGQIVNYWMYRNHPGEFMFQPLNVTDTGLDAVAIPAQDVIHLHDIRRPNEVRGMPLLSQSLILLSDLDRYLDAELVRKKAAALIGGFIKQPADLLGANPFVTGEGDETEEVHIEAMEPGSFPVLPPGYEVSFSDPTDVGANFKSFINQLMLQLAASLNLTYEQITCDPSQGNDRTIRATMLEFKRIAEQVQKNILVHQLCRTVFQRWFDLALLSGALVLPAGANERDYRRVRWIADPWDYMNPMQEVNTKIAEVRAGLVPRSEHIIRLGGAPEDIDMQFKADQNREKDMGLVFSTNVSLVSDAGIVQASDPTAILEGDAANPNPPADDNAPPADDAKPFPPKGGKDAKNPKA